MIAGTRKPGPTGSPSPGGAAGRGLGHELPRSPGGRLGCSETSSVGKTQLTAGSRPDDVDAIAFTTLPGSNPPAAIDAAPTPAAEPSSRRRLIPRPPRGPPAAGTAAGPPGELATALPLPPRSAMVCLPSCHPRVRGQDHQPVGEEHRRVGPGEVSPRAGGGRPVTNRAPAAI